MSKPTHLRWLQIIGLLIGLAIMAYGVVAWYSYIAQVVLGPDYPEGYADYRGLLLVAGWVFWAVGLAIASACTSGWFRRGLWILTGLLVLVSAAIVLLSEG